MAESIYFDKFNMFWEYFRKTWLESYDPAIHDVIQNNDNTLINRTNNAVERFNRKLNEEFPNAHLPMTSFVSSLQKITHEYAEDTRRIQKAKRRREDSHQDVYIPKLPVDIRTGALMNS